MQKVAELKLTASEAERIEAAIAECDEHLKRIFKDIHKDQAEIHKIGARTRTILADLKAS